MCLHNSPGNNKSRHLKQVTASLKSNILLCLESKGFEFLSAIHLSLMKHLLQFDFFQCDFSVWKRMKKPDWKPQNPWFYGAFPVCRNYTVRAHIRFPNDFRRYAARCRVSSSRTCSGKHHSKHICACNSICWRKGCTDNREIFRCLTNFRQSNHGYNSIEQKVFYGFSLTILFRICFCFCIYICFCICIGFFRFFVNPKKRLGYCCAGYTNRCLVTRFFEIRHKQDTFKFFALS